MVNGWWWVCFWQKVEQAVLSKKKIFRLSCTCVYCMLFPAGIYFISPHLNSFFFVFFFGRPFCWTECLNTFNLRVIIQPRLVFSAMCISLDPIELTKSRYSRNLRQKNGALLLAFPCYLTMQASICNRNVILRDGCRFFFFKEEFISAAVARRKKKKKSKGKPASQCIIQTFHNHHKTSWLTWKTCEVALRLTNSKLERPKKRKYKNVYLIAGSRSYITPHLLILAARF